MSTTNAINKRQLIGWLLSVLLPIIIWLIPTGAIFTPQLKLFFVITLFVMLIIAQELLPILISAILLPSLYVLSGLVDVTVGFSAWTNTTVWMILGGLIFSNVLDECGLLTRIAYWIIRKCGGTYQGAVFGCYIVGIVLNIVTFCNGWIVNCALVFGVCKAMGLKPSREASLVCFAGTIASCGSTVWLFHPGYASMIQTALAGFVPNFSMGMFTALKYNWLFAVWCVVAILILMKVYKVKNLSIESGKEFFDAKYQELGPISVKEKKSIVVVVILMAYLCSCQFTKLPAAYGFMTIPYLMFLPVIGVDDGSALKRTSLPTIFFVATCLGIGTVGNTVGFGTFLTDIAAPLLAGKSILIVCVALMLFGMLANFVMTPLAMLGGLAIPFAQVAVSVGLSPVAACMILLYSCDMVFLPYEATGNLVMYNYGMMPMKDFIKQQALKSLIMLIGFIIVMYPLWGVMGLL